MSWATRADRVLHELFRELRSEGVTDDAQIRKRIHDAYPFGMRQYHPYKVWLTRVKAWRAAYALGLSGPMGNRPAHPSRTKKPDRTTSDLFGE